jgi:hypothetical protein
MGFYFPGFLNGVSTVYLIPSLGIRSFYLVCHDVGLNGGLISIGFFFQTLGMVWFISYIVVLSSLRKGLPSNGAHKGISDVGKPHLRTRLLNLIREENNQVYIHCMLPPCFFLYIGLYAFDEVVGSYLFMWEIF